jgi:hypothetical protein
MLPNRNTWVLLGPPLGVWAWELHNLHASDELAIE